MSRTRLIGVGLVCTMRYAFCWPLKLFHRNQFDSFFVLFKFMNSFFFFLRNLACFFHRNVRLDSLSVDKLRTWGICINILVFSFCNFVRRALQIGKFINIEGKSDKLINRFMHNASYYDILSIIHYDIERHNHLVRKIGPAEIFSLQ